MFSELSNLTHPTSRANAIKELWLYSPAWSPDGIMYAVVTFTFIVYFWDTYLAYRQYYVLKKNVSVPPELAGVLNQAKYTKARLYELDRSKFQFAFSFWEQLTIVALLFFDGLPTLWSLSGNVISHFGYGKQYEIFQSIVFVLIGNAFFSIIDLPFDLCFTLFIEERHRIKKQTLGLFFISRIVSFVSEGLLSPIETHSMHIVKTGGDYYFIWLWVFGLCLLVLMAVCAECIEPYFDKLTPFPEGTLRTRIKKLANSIKFPLKKLHVGSKISTHSNAYFYGFFENKGIVLFDTLLEDYEPLYKKKSRKEKKKHRKLGCNEDEVLAVLAHELGHWKLNHSLKKMIIVMVYLFVCSFAFAFLYKNEALFAAFKFYDERPVIVGYLVIFEFVFSPCNEILEVLTTMLSRRFEFEADAFAKKLNNAADLRNALVKFSKGNSEFPLHDWLYSARHHPTPTFLQRIRALGKTD